MIQFCYKNVSKPRLGELHNYYKHRHIRSFNKQEGEQEFLGEINEIFSRNGLAYELCSNGEISKILDESLYAVIQKIELTKDLELNEYIKQAKIKISSPNIQVRYEALKELWDAFERIKTVLIPKRDQKNTSVNELLKKCSPSNQEFYVLLDDDFKKLTKIGNDFLIRHSEAYQIKLEDTDHIDYLFHRGISLIHLAIKKLNEPF